MEQQRWRQIEELYHSAMELDLNRRDAYLAKACEGDETLRHEVEGLLAQDVLGNGFLERPIIGYMGDSTVSQLARQVDGEPPGPLPAGTVLNSRFRILRAAGAGGMGYVYEAEDQKLGQRVALKCAKPGFSERLPPEVRAAREVSHFNVCKVHDLHVASTPLGEMEFLSMEFVEGQTLSDRIRGQGPMAPREAREIARQICAGVAQAHRQGVIHGDLKPGNVIVVSADPSGTRAVVTDFGLARMNLRGAAAINTTREGTLDYMAPELFLGEKSTVASDIYALGILLHVMLTGHAPKRAVMAGPLKLAPPLPPNSRAETITAGAVIVDADWQRKVETIPAPWESVIKRCIAPQPLARFPGAGELARALEPRRLLLKSGALAAGAATLALGIWQWTGEPAGPPVRLAVLPFTVQGDPVPGAGGIALDVARRLSGARRNFTVISPHEAERFGVQTAVKAKSILGATHLLEAHLNRSGATVKAMAAVTDLATGRTLGKPLSGSYASDDSAALAKAILATVTGSFELRGKAPKESVSKAAYVPYVEGIALLQEDAYNADKAIAEFEKAIALDPKSALPYAGLADAQVKKFDNREGPKWLELAGVNVAKAETINADSAPVLLVSGALLERQGSYESALHAFTRAAALAPTNPEVWKRLAEAYDKANRSNDAVATYHHAMEAQPDYYENYLSLGNFYWYRSEFKQAEDLYRRVTAMVPDLATGHMDLGLALMEQGRFPEAESSLLRAVALHRSPLTLMNLGGLYYAEEQFETAASMFEESVASGTPSAIRYRDLGDVYRRLGKERRAAEAYRLAKGMAEDEVTRNPRQADSRILLAVVSAHLGDAGAAQFEALQALSMEPENAIVMREAVLMYEALHRRDDSLRLLAHAPRWVLSELSRQPDSRSLQRDPRFVELLQAQGSK